jgi:hypothetical protein
MVHPRASRAPFTGGVVSPGIYDIYEVIAVFGRERTVARLGAAASVIAGQRDD